MISRKTELNRIELFKDLTSIINSQLASEDFVFFDIETTGLEASSSALYLIGYMCIEQEKLVLTQLFAENFSDQSLLVSDFQKVINTHKCLIHFNGQTFDIPYLEKKGCSFGNILSFDIYRELKIYKSFFALSSMKQKNLEKYVGLSRRDQYDGGTLIEFYLKFLAANKINKLKNTYKDIATPFNHELEINYNNESGLPYLNNANKDYLLDTLFLHNYEDVEGMLDVALLLAIKPDNICRILNVKDIIYDDVQKVTLEIKNTAYISLFNRILKKYNTYEARQTDKQILLKNIISFSYSDGAFTIEMTPLKSTLKQYFSNYKDYCYLIAEDKIIPKELAKFMDKALYKKATADTCYTSYEGTFIPVTVNTNPDINKHYFKESYNSSIIYLTDKEFNSLTSDELIKILITLYMN